MKNNVTGSSLRLAIPIAAYFAGALWAVHAYRFQINPDGISYISIAQKYVSREFPYAINAYWSPLYSWLLVPLLAVGLPALLATKILAVLLGVAALGGSWRISRNLGLREESRIALCGALVPLMLYLGLSVTTPDLLSVVILLFYLAGVTRHDYAQRPFAGVFAGLWGGLGYLAKAYVMWFFLLHFVLINAMLLYSRKGFRRQVAIRFAMGLFVFAVISGTWTSIISWRYGMFTTGSAAPYNLAFEGPRKPGYPMFRDGFFAPPNPTAVSTWEDPTHHAMEKWNPFETKENVKHLLRHVRRNLWDALDTIQRFSILSAAIILISATVVGSRLDPRPRRPALLLLLAVALYPLGYLCIHIDPRYLALLQVLLPILGVYLADLAGLCRIGRRRHGLILLVVCGSFLVWPTWYLWKYRGSGGQMHRKAEKLAGAVPAGSRIASDIGWPETLCFAFYRGAAYYGEAKPGAPASEIEADLTKLGIQYFVVWDEPHKYPFTATWPEVTQGRVAGLRIYRLPGK